MLNFIVTRTIMDMCLEAERKPGLRLSSQWWEYPAIEILRIRVGHAAAEVGGGNRRERERESRIGKDVGRETEMTRRNRYYHTKI